MQLGSQVRCLHCCISYNDTSFDRNDIVFLHMNYVRGCILLQQECIPVGCVPPACCSYLPACTASRWGVYPPGTCPGGVPAWGVVPAQGGVTAQGGGCTCPEGCTCPRGCTCPGGCTCPRRDVPAWGVVPAQGGMYLPWGVYLPRGVPAQVLPPLWTDRHM